MKKYLTTCCLLLVLCSFAHSEPDILIRVEKSQMYGEITAIADDYLEFKKQVSPGEYEWIKVPKQELLAVISNKGNILYPRDKYDENALNYGRIKVKSSQDKKKYLERKKNNKQIQSKLEHGEKNRYKTAFIAAGTSCLVIWAVINKNR